MVRLGTGSKTAFDGNEGQKTYFRSAFMITAADPAILMNVLKKMKKRMNDNEQS